MINDLKYSVRSREIVDLFSAMKSQRLSLTSYFQRNLVWRDAHKRDFIDTLMKGYPVPQIFLARGPIDLESMEANQCVVDGQQRLNTIREYIEGKLLISGEGFRDLESKKKEDFLKYEVAVIDFDLDAGDPRLKEVFHRLNRTYYSLSAIEKIASEYSASEFLLLARLLSGDIPATGQSIPDELVDEEFEESGDFKSNVFLKDPGIEETSWNWLTSHADSSYAKLISTRNIFSNFEFDRKVPLMFTLNVMCTYLSGYFNRNDKVRRFLEEKNSIFSERDEVLAALNSAADVIGQAQLPDSSIWWAKANYFTLICEIAKNPEIKDINPTELFEKLENFAKNVPEDYSLAAREAVGRKAQREFRGRTVREFLLNN